MESKAIISFLIGIRAVDADIVQTG